MNQKNNGGPGFPVHPDVRDDEVHAGMTLCDYFAGQALAGLATSQDSDGTWRHGDPDEIACRAYQIANAMLRTRKLP